MSCPEKSIPKYYLNQSLDDQRFKLNCTLLIQVNIPKDLKVYKLPHFMGKQRDAYHSTSVLGEIYDTVVSFETKAPPPVGR